MTKFRPTSSTRGNILPVVLLLYLLGVELCHSLNYTSVEGFGHSCPRLDSCAHLRSSGSRQLVSSVKERNCACDYLCAEYGDCCVDAAGNDKTDAEDRRIECYELKQFGGVYMRDSCPPTYGGPEEVVRLCRETDPADQSDPLGSMPVTDSLTGLTYKNYYCSMCDGRTTDDVTLWTPRLECPLLTLFNDSSGRSITDEYVLRNLATDGRRWGLYLQDRNSNNGSLFFHECDVDPVMPRELESKIRLCRPDLVSECPGNWTGDRVRNLCRSYMGARYVHGGEHSGYRNVHCALCNGADPARLSCQSAQLRGVDIFRHFGTYSFALLLDINEGRGREVGRVKVCENGEVFDPFFRRCRSLTCLPGFVRRGRLCEPVQKPLPGTEAPGFPVTDSSADNATTNATAGEQPVEIILPDLNLSSGKSYNVSSAVGKFLNCLLISLADGDYVMLPNRTVFVPRYGRLYEPTAYHTADGSVLVCTHFDAPDATKFLPLLGYVTVAGLGVSMFFLALHFAAFCLVPDLRNLSGRNLTSQCLALFLAYSCFVAGQFESLNERNTACAAVAFLTFYFFQVSFFWMAVMAYDVWRTLKMATTELRVSGGRQVGRFCVYSFLAWATPLFLLAALAFAEYTDLFPPAYRPGFRSVPCWFRQRRSLLVFFAAPLFAIMLANVMLFAASARMIVVTTGQTSSSSTHQRRNFQLYLRLALLMGLTWVVGLVAGYADVPFLFYLFVVLNTLQGLFIFAAFSCNSKVLAHLRSRFFKPRRREFKSSGNSTGSAFSTKPTTLMIRS